MSGPGLEALSEIRPFSGQKTYANVSGPFMQRYFTGHRKSPPKNSQRSRDSVKISVSKTLFLGNVFCLKSSLSSFQIKIVSELPDKNPCLFM
jgi:hypothetical protein